MSKDTLLTEHGNKRLKERVKNSNRSLSFLKVVVKNGKSKNDYIDVFYKYLKSREKYKNIKVKVYNKNIYIFGSNNNHKLITTYPVPKRFLPTEKFEISKKVKEIVLLINKSKSKVVFIKTKDICIFGYVSFYYNKSFSTLMLRSKSGNIYEINLEDIIELKVDNEIIKYNSNIK